MHISVQLCVILIRSIVNLLALHYSPPQHSSSPLSALIPTASSTASVSVFFCGRPGHAGEQALPGAIHIPQVSLSLWMMFLPNYLDPEPWHLPHRTHILNALKTPATFLPELPSFFYWTTNTANANINPGWSPQWGCVCAPLSSSSLVLLSLFRGGEHVKVGPL